MPNGFDTKEMGLVQTILKPLKRYPLSHQSTSEDIVKTILDEVVLEHTELIADIEDKKVDSSLLKHQIEKYVDSKKGIFDPESVKQQIFDMIYGYGKLEPYIHDASISDIDAPRYDYILAKRQGVVEVLPVTFKSEEAFERFCKVLIIRHGGVINAVDTHCRVSDKFNFLRINVSIPPRNVSGTALSIRKHPKEAHSFDSLQALGFLNSQLVTYLTSMNINLKNILICGKGGSGKTTLLRSLVESGQLCERVLICESDTEIYPQKKNTIVQQIQKKSELEEMISLERLISEGLTMSLDTYCIGEITGPEALPFIRAGHTGHRILGTIHSSSPLEALDRLLMLIENKTSLTESMIKTMIGKSIDVIVFVNQFRVSAILEVIGYNHETMQYNCEVVYGGGHASGYMD